MKKTILHLSVLVIAIGPTIYPILASEVDDILKELNGDPKKSGNSQISSDDQNAPQEKPSPSTKGRNSEVFSEPSAKPERKKKAVIKQAAPKQDAPQRPSIPVWNPRDKLPKDITGHGVAGNFAIEGSSSDGTLVLVPAEDADSPFARQFWVVNRMFAGGQPNILVPIGQRQLVQVPKNQPLIFIGRGILPGVYNVQAQ
jgi:hypothetical protein